MRAQVKNRNTPLLRSGLVALAVLGAVGAAQAAGTDTTTFKVKLVITESCTISTTAPTDVDFGSQGRVTTAVAFDAAGALNVNCSAGTPYTIGLNGGVNSLGTANAPVAGNRRMKLGATTTYVPYELYQNAGRTTFWGNTIGTSTVAGTGTGSSVALPVFGRVISVNSAAGSYEDTITATVTY